jgi:hypothetical protein
VKTEQTYGKQAECVPRVVLHRSLPDGKHLRRKARPQRMSAKRAQADRDGGGERTECQKNLQAGFLVFFLARCGRFLP